MKTITLLLIAASASAQDLSQPPADARVKFVTQGVGVQIYSCTAHRGEYTWVLQEPQADLIDAKEFTLKGLHTKGPTWTWKDGSSITGTVLHTQPSPDETSNIPWLLLQATSSGTKGALDNIAYVRRSDTDGGVAPSAGCDAQFVNTTTRIPYKATYTFYTKAQ